MAGGMETQDYSGVGRDLEAEAFGANLDAAIGSHAERGAEAPNIRPPWAARSRAQDGAFFLLGPIPSLLRGPAQFAMDFVGVVMEAQSLDLGIGRFDFGDFFTGKIRREPALPVLVLTLDFALGLGRWGIAEADVVKFEGPAQLGQSFGVVGKKEAVIIHIDLHWAAVAEKSGWEEIEVGEEEFSRIEFGTDEEAAAIVQHIEHGKLERGGGEPAMGRSVQLPEFADLGTLPALHGGVRALDGSGMGMTVGDGPAADLGAVEFKVVQPQGFRGGEAVGTRRDASQPFFQESSDWLRPGGGVIPT